MENVESQDTLRDTLNASFDAVTEAATPVEKTGEKHDEEAAQRARDEAGRFAKQEPATQSAVEPKAAPQADIKAGVAPATSQAPAVAAPVRPSSWKKDYWADYDKIAAENPKLADYLNQREREFATGVSTYKAEAENARQLNEAIAPYAPLLQQHGVQAPALIGNLLEAHRQLALGSPMEKLQKFATLMNQYGVDPQNLFQVLSGQQPNLPQQTAPMIQPPDIEKIVEAKLTQKEINNEYQRFLSEAPEKYPHFEAVKETMAGLLQAELAQDYASAYEAAIRHPRHADIFDAMQTAQREQAAAAEREKAQMAVKSARSKTISMPSSTPSAPVAKVNGKQGLRDQLSEAFDSITTSRV